MIDAKLLQLVVEASRDGIVVTEQEGDENILIYANPAFSRLTGYTRDEVLYQDCRFLQGDDQDQEGVRFIREAIARREPCRRVLRNYRKDGSVFWNELSIAPAFNEGDQLTYFIGIQKDVTTEVEAVERVRVLETELEQLRYELAALRALLC